MNPDIRITSDDGDTLQFQITNANVSIVNGLRRILLSSIPTVVIKTFPYVENKCDIQINTCRLNNEILKQRLSCIPIHLTDHSIPLEQYLVVVDKKNDSDMIEYITTEDFQIVNTTNGKNISKSERDKIFPKNKLTGQYIDFCRLRPKLSDNMEGEHVKFSATMQLGTAKENGMFNAVSKSTYGATMDKQAAAVAWSDKEKELAATGLSSDDIEYEKKNWYLLEALRYTVANSFDFTVETVGVFENRELVKIACDMMNKKLLAILEDNAILVSEANSTINNCYDITLYNEDYTIGKVLEYILYTLHYEGDNTLSFIGFRKNHPHDTESILRLAFAEQVEGDMRIIISEYLGNAVTKSVEIFKSISSNF